MKTRARAAAGLLFAAFDVTSVVARADDAGATARAKVLFAEGRRLLENKQYDQACPMLAESSRLAAANGPLLALAMCHEGQGKTATAWSEYNEVVTRTRLQGQPDWAARAERAAAALEPRLSRLQITLDTTVAADPAVVVKRDGHVLGREGLGVALPVDPGAHVVEAGAPGHATWSTQVLVADGATLAVLVPWPGPMPEAPPSHASALLRTLGLATSGAGLLGLGVGAYFVLQATSKNDDSKRDCMGDFCGAAGKQARLDAISDANLATGVFVASGVLLVGAATLLVLGKVARDRSSVTLSATSSAELTGMMVRGTF
jgi:hypothetical protein